MQLNQAQINKFIELNKNCVGFENYSEKEISEIANGIANYYLTLFSIQQRLKIKDKNMTNIGGISNE